MPVSENQKLIIQISDWLPISESLSLIELLQEVDNRNRQVTSLLHTTNGINSLNLDNLKEKNIFFKFRCLSH